MQLPPIHSAIKQKGKPVYLLARKGIDVIMEPRKINIHEFEITNINLPVFLLKWYVQRARIYAVWHMTLDRHLGAVLTFAVYAAHVSEILPWTEALSMEEFVARKFKITAPRSNRRFLNKFQAVIVYS